MATAEQELMKSIRMVLVYWADHIAQEVMSRWMQIGYKPNLKGNAEIKERIIKLTSDAIMMEITGIGQRALEMEYGRGSKMDMLNPYLSEYIVWSGFNERRFDRDMAILSRKGKYQDLDGKWHKSNANPGKNLEKTGNPKYAPEEPHHVIRNVVCGKSGEGGLLPGILADIAEVILTYNFFKSMPNKIRL